MVESRTDLLDWINEVCGLNYTKIEQCGTGAAYCQIIDSIYRDVSLSKVKFDSKLNHELITNYKILQNAFTKHKITKHIPVNNLLKMKMQDNLDFLHWLKPFWETNKPDDFYDPLSRRKATGTTSKPLTNKPTQTTTRRTVDTSKPRVSKADSGFSSRGPGITGATSRDLLAGSSTGRSTIDKRAYDLQNEVEELSYQLINLSSAHEALVEEREFYYHKLRDIELLIQHEISNNSDSAHDETIKDMLSILYSTDEGFELPEEEDIEHLELPEEINQVIDEIF